MSEDVFVNPLTPRPAFALYECSCECLFLWKPGADEAVPLSAQRGDQDGGHTAKEKLCCSCVRSEQVDNCGVGNLSCMKWMYRYRDR